MDQEAVQGNWDGFFFRLERRQWLPSSLFLIFFLLYWLSVFAGRVLHSTTVRSSNRYPRVMAKKQTFGDKVKTKGGNDFKVAKLVYSVKSEKTSAWKFMEKNVRIPNGEKDQKVLADFVSKATG